MIVQTRLSPGALQPKPLGGGTAIAIAKATEMLRQVKADAEAVQASEEAV